MSEKKPVLGVPFNFGALLDPLGLVRGIGGRALKGVRVSSGGLQKVETVVAAAVRRGTAYAVPRAPQPEAKPVPEPALPPRVVPPRRRISRTDGATMSVPSSAPVAPGRITRESAVAEGGGSASPSLPRAATKRVPATKRASKESAGAKPTPASDQTTRSAAAEKTTQTSTAQTAGKRPTTTRQTSKKTAVKKSAVKKSAVKKTAVREPATKEAAATAPASTAITGAETAVSSTATSAPASTATAADTPTRTQIAASDARDRPNSPAVDTNAAEPADG